MTFQQIYNSVAALRFNTALITASGGIKEWIRARESDVWAYADWPVKGSAQLSLVLTNGNAGVTLPGGWSSVLQGLHIYDDYGAELDYLEPEDFFASYGASPSAPVSNQRPVAWTIVTDSASPGTQKFYVGPAPNGAYTFYVQGWNLPIKRTAAATFALGTMTSDTDLPWWPDDYHDFLIDGTIARGKRLQSDPSWQADEQAFQDGLQRLEGLLMPGERAPVRQFGKVWS